MFVDLVASATDCIVTAVPASGVHGESRLITVSSQVTDESTSQVTRERFIGSDASVARGRLTVGSVPSGGRGVARKRARSW
jgi:hypothetical protein